MGKKKKKKTRDRLDPDPDGGRRRPFLREGSIASQQKSGKLKIGKPLGFVHNAHINRNFEWTGVDPEKVFTVHESLGGSDSVFRAVHNDSELEFAIKILPLVSELGDKKMAQVKNESEVLLQCKHPNLVKYYGCMARGHYIWMIMEYCEVGTVKDLMEHKPFKEAHVATITYDLLKALEFLHRKGLTHCDIKPSNIVVTADARILVTDLGSAIQSGMVARDATFSLLYADPVLIEGAPPQPAFDVWSLGVTVIHLKEGSIPFAEDRKMTARRKILEDGYKPTFARPKRQSKLLRSFVLSCFDSDLLRRPLVPQLLQHKFLKKCDHLRICKRVNDLRVSRRNMDADVKVQHGNNSLVEKARGEVAPVRSGIDWESYAKDAHSVVKKENMQANSSHLLQPSFGLDHRSDSDSEEDDEVKGITLLTINSDFTSFKYEPRYVPKPEFLE